MRRSGVRFLFPAPLINKLSFTEQPGVSLRVAGNFPVLIEFLDEFVTLLPVFVFLRPWRVRIAGRLSAIEGSLLSLFESFLGMS